ncbi:hypothetical protein Tco_0419088 [Tanacetum coccineum]
MKDHTIDRCFEINGYPNGFKKNQNAKSFSNNKGNSSNNVDVKKNSSGMPFTSDQIAKLMSLIGDKPGNGIHANMAGIQCSFFNANVFFNNNFYKFFNANIKANGVSYNFGWIIDSEANQHITSSTSNMTNVIDIAELNITVGHPNGTTTKIRKVANLKLTNNIVLFDVLVIPEYCVSLLFVNKLVRDSKLHVGIDEDVKFYETIFPYKMSSKKDKCLVKNSSELKMFFENDDAPNHKTFFDDFQTDSQASSPNDDGREPSSSNIGSESDSDDIAREQSSDNEQEPMQIGEEDFSEGNNFENFEVPNLLFNTEESTGESNTLRRSSRQSKLPHKLNDYVLNSKARYGLDKFVNHTWLSAENCGFIANVNKIFEPKTYEEAALDKN